MSGRDSAARQRSAGEPSVAIAVSRPNRYASDGLGCRRGLTGRVGWWPERMAAPMALCRKQH
jgi:hypothetical protein